MSSQAVVNMNAEQFSELMDMFKKPQIINHNYEGLEGTGGGGGIPLPVPTTPGSTSLQVGETVFIRTVTMYFVGVIDSITDTDLVLSEVSWIADTGDFKYTLNKGTLKTYVRYPSTCTVMRGGIIDVSPWTHDLPT